MKFYLGTHEPYWLGRTCVPLFISVVRLRRHARSSTRLPKARGSYALDSAGFSRLSEHGSWDGISDEQYIGECDQAIDEIGMMDFAAPKDWMCEPIMLAKTGKTVHEHQKLTIESFLSLRAKAPHVPWCPVLQGWKPDDYERHIEMYAAEGVDLRAAPTVGVGSVCRREGTLEGAEIMRRVADRGIRIHAFGIKTAGLKLFGDRIASADSMAWSFAARRRPIRLPGCKHAKCANCYKWAHQWRDEVLAGSPKTAAQTTLNL